MAATRDKITYSGAFGKRDSASGINVDADSIFMIASMTKPVTSVAAMQLVEQGKLKLDEPASTYIQELGTLQVLHGFDPNTGKPILKPATKPVTLRTLLTHTSGFVYDTWFADMLRYEKVTGTSMPLGTVAPLTPLMFEPGSRWQYGTSADWSGRLVETVSGLTLEQYFQKNILKPLGHGRHQLPRTRGEVRSHGQRISPRAKTARSTEDPRALPPPPKVDNGGGGLYSTARDYVRFTQMILRRGRGPGGEEILQPKTVDMMATNPDRPSKRGKIEDRAAGHLERRRFSSGLQRRLRFRLPDQFQGLQRRPFGRQPGLGRRGEHILLDRSPQGRRWRNHDAVSAVRRQRSHRRAGRFRARRVRGVVVLITSPSDRAAR